MRYDNYKLPDFFICGAAKAGTTSLWRYLLQHPSVFMPSTFEDKEPGYFSSLRPMNSLPEYARLFEQAREDQIIGEASGAYLTSPDSAERIASMLPEARIIIMLRNPAERAYALYKWMVREGYEPISSFREALIREKTERFESDTFKKHNPEYYYNYLYFHSGLYSHQVKRFLDHFPEQQVKFILFERFTDHTLDVIREVCKFLGVEQDFMPVIRQYNRGSGTYFPKLQYFLNQYLGQLWRFSSHNPVRQLMKLNMTNENRKMDESLKQELLEAYKQDIVKTERLINRDLQSYWL